MVIICACQNSQFFRADEEDKWENLAYEGNLQLMLSDTELLLSSKHGCISRTGFYTESLIQTINAMAEAKCVKQIHEDAFERMLADPSYQNWQDNDKDNPLLMSTANLRVLLTPHREPGGGETQGVELEGGEQQQREAEGREANPTREEEGPDEWQALTEQPLDEDED